MLLTLSSDYALSLSRESFDLFSLFAGSRSTMLVNISREPLAMLSQYKYKQGIILDCALYHKQRHSAVLICVYS